MRWTHATVRYTTENMCPVRFVRWVRCDSIGSAPKPESPVNCARARLACFPRNKKKSEIDWQWRHGVTNRKRRHRAWLDGVESSACLGHGEPVVTRCVSPTGRNGKDAAASCVTQKEGRRKKARMDITRGTKVTRRASPVLNTLFDVLLEFYLR